ncbi:hypothetical protein ACVBIL_04920 [Shewanella sp. 125m-7]
MKKLQSVCLMSTLLLALPLSVSAKAPLEGEPEWEAKKKIDKTKQAEQQRLLQQLKRIDEAEKKASQQLEKDGL